MSRNMTTPTRRRRAAATKPVEAPQMPPTLEKDHERLGDELMETYGFFAVRFSQARATMQTEGIPDRLYCSTTRGLAFWWEAKREDGKQRAAQRDFQVTVNACGQVYFCGTFGELSAWFADEIKRGWPSWRLAYHAALGRLNNKPAVGV